MYITPAACFHPPVNGAMFDSEKLPTIESPQGIDSAPKSKHILSCDRRQIGVAFDQEIPNEQAFHQKLQTHLSEAPDGGMRAWLAVFAAALVTFSTFGFSTSWGVSKVMSRQTCSSCRFPPFRSSKRIMRKIFCFTLHLQQ